MTNIDPRKIISALILIAGVGTAVYLGSETSEKTSKEKFLASIEAIPFYGFFGTIAGSVGENAGPNGRRFGHKQ